MMQKESSKLFEQISDSPFASNGIRPGGLALTRRALERTRLHAGSRILDVGCGTGVTVQHLLNEHRIRAVGIDSSSVLVARGKVRDPALPLLMGNAGALPFPDASFDGVLLECTLTLVPDRERVLTECHRVLKPLGKLIVTDLYARNPEAIKALRRLSVRSCLQGALNKDEFIQECFFAGFILSCFEDHSEALREFAARLVWHYGSLDALWVETGTSSADHGCILSGIREARPGYFLYTGSKVGEVVRQEGERREQ
jgi:arsenite methyltransferase